MVTPRNGKFVIVCGERRFRAAKLVKLSKLPCVVRPDLDEKGMLELSITENLQREDLTPMDEARAFHALIEKCGYTQKQLSKRLGLSEPAVNFKLSLLKLTPELQEAVHKGQLNETQGRTIVQQVRKIRGKDAEKKQHAAMKKIHDRIAEVRVAKPKLDAKEVKAVAKTVVDEEKKSKSSRKRTALPKASKPAAPNVKEKAQLKRFSSALAKVKAAMKPFEAVVRQAKTRDRFADVLLLTHKNAAEQIKGSAVVMTAVYEAVLDAKRRSLAAKHS